MFQNLMEEIVVQQLDGMIAEQGCCGCDSCKSDVAAYALNRLPPRYVATRTGQLLTKLQSCESQFRVDVAAALGEAVHLVGQRPNHNNRD